LPRQGLEGAAQRGRHHGPRPAERCGDRRRRLDGLVYVRGWSQGLAGARRGTGRNHSWIAAHALPARQRTDGGLDRRTGSLACGRAACCTLWPAGGGTLRALARHSLAWRCFVGGGWRHRSGVSLCRMDRLAVGHSGEEQDQRECDE
jgi:hypothetical protein